MVGLVIKSVDVNFGPPPDNFWGFVPDAWGFVGAFGGVVAGAIAGTIGLWIDQKITVKAGGALSGLVGGAIGAVIGLIAPHCWFIARDYLHFDNVINTIEILLLISVPGAIIGAICGLAVAIFGMRNLSVIPMIAILGFLAGGELGWSNRRRTVVSCRSPGCIRRGDWRSHRSVHCNDG